MKKKVIAIVCAVAVLAAAGGGVTWHFLETVQKRTITSSMSIL